MYVQVIRPYCDEYSSRAGRGVHGFDPEREYLVHHIESYSESGNGFVVLVNDQKEIWWVDNRHVRVTREDPAPSFTFPQASLNGASLR
jgi:hypothetical protein